MNAGWMWLEGMLLLHGWFGLNGVDPRVKPGDDVRFAKDDVGLRLHVLP